ncbi:MAG: HlyD family secretion protein [Proteobacteria bacterium ST_bin12]|nr:MAG: HlyD family secretion protein [Proteobacteria bacterium ST_bin12]
MKFIALDIKKSLLRINMNQKKMWFAVGFMTITILLICIKLIAEANQPSKALHQPLQAVVQESTLNTVNLSDDSFRKLGIQIGVIKYESLTANKTYGGEIILPAGGVVSVSAPISGKLISLEKSQLKSGEQVKVGQLLYRIQPIISADARANLVNALADADSLVNVTKSQVDATQIALNRAKKLLEDLVGSQRNVDDANAAHEIALRNLEAAHAKRNALYKVVNLGTVEPIDIKTPKAGIVSNIFAVTDQLVSAGNPIVEISTLNSLWVRVPIPAGDLEAIDQQAEAKIQPLSATSKAEYLIAKPVKAPPTADLLTSSKHLYYAIQSDQSALGPMQRVSVTLNTQSKSNKALTLPWSAVVFDVYGGSWVYTQQSKNLYERKRVFLDYVSGNRAIISDGPPEGSKIVVNGALELFGVETGFAH